MKYEIKTSNLLIILGVILVVFGSVTSSEACTSIGGIMVVGTMIGTGISYFIN